MANRWPAELIRILKAKGGTDDGVGAPVLVDPARFPMAPAGTTPAVIAELTAAQGGIASGAAEGWHEIGAASEPAFTNSWVNYGGGQATAAFRKLPSGLVLVKGLIKSGTMSNAAFTLPAGYRPSTTIDLVAASNSALGLLDISTAGAVRPYSGSNVWFALNNVFFFAGA